MAVSFSLEQMSVQDKLQAMEVLWDDLCDHAGGMESPNWHKEVLMDRETAVAAGKETVSNWADAKKRIRDQLL